MSSLAERFSQLASTTPAFQDPEDETNEESTPQLVQNVGHDQVDESASQLRKHAAPLLSDINPRYSGRKVSRKSLVEESFQGFEGSDEESDLDIDSFTAQLKSSERKNELSNDLEDETSDENITSDGDLSGASSDSVKKDNEEATSDEDEETDKEEENEERNSSEEDSEDDVDDGSSENVDVIQRFSKIDINEELEKGKAVQAQLELWDRLLELRIKLQKMLALANRFPQFNTYKEFVIQGGDEYTEHLDSGKKNLKSVLDSLLGMQEDLLQQNLETELSKTPSATNDDDEILSSTEDEVEKLPPEEEKSKVSKKKNSKKTLRDKDYPGVLDKRFKDFSQYRNMTIQKWNEKTRIASGKLHQKSFASFEQSALKQIEQILSDKDRLRRRTQLKRSLYSVVGKCDDDSAVNIKQAKSGKEPQERKTDSFKDYDPEIFDDSDFYHQLLRELIERKTADVNDPVALSRQWLEVQRLRSKMKKKVDTKASKGRKIRFDVHSKLINFMAPVDNSKMSDEAKNEVFGSLFGKINSSYGSQANHDISLFSVQKTL